MYLSSKSYRVVVNIIRSLEFLFHIIVVITILTFIADIKNLHIESLQEKACYDFKHKYI